MFTRSALLALATLGPLVAAHGSLHFAEIDGVRYMAPNPSGDFGDFAIRAVNRIDPVKGTDNAFLSCGHNAQPAALVADANPGSTIAFSWMNGRMGDWIHDTGAVMTYMASCGNSGCANFNSADAQFFKLNQFGKKNGPGWIMADLTTSADATLKVTLPTDLPGGEYLIRHELLALHQGGELGGAEFYPGCLQIRLAAPPGTPAPLPSGNQVVQFPGGYNAEDPGIHYRGAYNPSEPYTFPGPPVISNASPSDPTGPAPSPTSTDIETPGSTNVPTPPDNGCGYPERKVKRVIKRIVRREPMFEDQPLVKRDATPAPAPDVHHVRADHLSNVVRSRVMRGVF